MCVPGLQTKRLSTLEIYWRCLWSPPPPHTPGLFHFLQHRPCLQVQCRGQTLRAEEEESLQLGPVCGTGASEPIREREGNKPPAALSTVQQRAKKVALSPKR